MRLTAPHANLGRLFSSVAPDRIAAIDVAAASGPRRTSYGELDALSDGVARGLAGKGLGAGDRVAILSLNRTEYVAALFGALRLGAVPVPVNIKLGADTIQGILANSGAHLAFVESAIRARLAGTAIEHVVAFDDFDAFLDRGSFEAIEPAPEQVSMQIYTSGTTGAPKGTLLTHAGQIWAAETLTAARRLTAEDRAVLSAPFFHKNALVAIKTALLPGATMLILPRFDIEYTIAAIRDQGATMLTGVPTMMAMLLQRRDLLDPVDTTGIRVVSMGSAPASETLLEAIAARFPNAEIHLNYGTTEGGPIMTGWYGADGRPQPPNSVGWPIPGCAFRLVDGPSDREGELWVKNPGVAIGYHLQPDKTAERFIDGWYRTGDVVRLDEEGWMYFVGRTDDMFVVGGENVYPQDVETLLERHPSVAQAAVLPFAHELKGQVPYAFVVPAGSEVDEAELRTYALEHGPAYAHPRRIVVVDEIPLTGTNKIDKARLRALAEQS